MNTNATIEKMQKMRLNGMKRAYESSFETRNQDTLGANPDKSFGIFKHTSDHVTWQSIINIKFLERGALRPKRNI
jgi:hypothetical protein